MGAPPISDKAALIRTWLMTGPGNVAQKRPSKVMAYAADGREWDMDVPERINWAQLAATIESLDCERLEALDEKGKLLRATTMAELYAKEAKKEEQRAAVTAAMQTQDPETQRMIVFAELLERAYGRAYDMSQQTIQAAFERIGGICDSLATQANAANASANELTVGIRNLMIQHAQEVADSQLNQPEQSPLEKLAGNFLVGQEMSKFEQQQAAVTTTAAKPNGKH